jgi:hypothetical protein
LASDRLKIAKEEIELMLRQGIIQPSKSPWYSPIHLALKKDEKIRLCGDYRALKNRTKSDRYAPRFLEDFTQNLQGSKIFSNIDLIRAYNQISVAPESIEKTAIITPFGLFEYLFTLFGLLNATQTCQRFVDKITCELDFVFAYIDYFFIYLKNEEEHLKHLKILFEPLNEYGVIINVSKSVFDVKEIEFLGNTVNSDNIKLTPEKTQVISDFPKPLTIRQLRRFLQMINFYRRFIPAAAKELAPLKVY